ncbi:hypothetical protein C5Z26_01210 [Lactobacillus sp. CBA3606]|uniref:sulfotransferase family protein n=1 Tax=Lactobacillus sp. CBA3606 TaxID=2099789 RepID=UPI000CFD4A03|nr:sulfotransferase [Lactobacillus sp. CBA3606]AVK62821.1 hypothetical protein C5Z26_01210 [Lactobacillus sp. CBA3606]
MTKSILQRLFAKHQTKKAVLILGSGRSGTSVLTRCINLMGISLGTDNLLAPSKKINPKGYFENKDIIKIHKSLGGKLRYRPAFEGYYDSPKIKQDRQDLTNYLTNFFENESYLAIKDPRMNDYIDLWQQVLAEIDVQPAEIILLRHPLDVVSSNERAWHRDTTLAMRQWQVRTLLSLRDTHAQNRILVTYEDLFNQPLATLHRIADKLGLPWPTDEAALSAEIDDFIDPKLQQSDSGESVAAFAARTDVAPDVKALYLLGMQAADDETFFESADFNQQIQALTTAYLTDYGALYRDFNAKITHETVFVFGNHQTEINQVNAQLINNGVVMENDQTADSHDDVVALTQSLKAGVADIKTYTKDFSLVERKENLNNYLRRHAKRTERWGVGDAAMMAVPEMVTTVSAEIGADTHHIVIAEDYMAIENQAQLQTALQHLIRTVQAVQQRPYLVVLAEELESDATAQRIQTFINTAAVAQPAVLATATSKPIMLKTPLDWQQVAENVTRLCEVASQGRAGQAELNQFIDVNATKILKQIGDK